ncbi:MAG: hypothetical protein EPGJADBJ_04184 [Saprospiraceae bacterium]|nr:hypothetical protein [Saprospiraceae bacterium]
MRTKFTWIHAFCCVVILFLFLNNRFLDFENDLGYTQAPGDGLCSDCHTPTTSASLSISSLPQYIQPNKEYTITVSITRPNNSSLLRAGFQSVILNAAGGVAGEMISASPRSEVDQHINNNNGVINYFESEEQTVDEFADTNTISWKLKWMSPGEVGTTVKVYAGGVVADDFNSNFGALSVGHKNFTAVVEAPPTVTLNVSDVTCYGQSNGMVTAMASGPNSPFSYSWSNGAHTNKITNLAPGVYSVTVTNAHGLTTTAEAVVNQPPELFASATVIDPILCFGGKGTVFLEESGGEFPYLYSFNNGPFQSDNVFGNISGGTYLFAIKDANNCVETGSVFLSQPTALNSSISHMNVSCYGGSNGSLNLTPSGGTPEYSYHWSNGAVTQDLNNLVAGTYVVTISDMNGCLKVVSQSIAEPPPLTTSAVITHVTCNGDMDGSINLNTSGGTGALTYDWSPDGPDNPDNDLQDLDSLSAGVFSVTVTDMNGCIRSDTFTVEQTAFVLNAAVTNISCYGALTGAIDLSPGGGTGPLTYDWNTDGPDSLDNDPQDLDSLVAGTYIVEVTNSVGCVQADTFIVTQAPALVLEATVSNVLCDGAATGAIDIAATGGTGPLTFDWNTDGPDSLDNDMRDLDSLVAGTYIVEVTDSVGCVQADTFIVTQAPALVLEATVLNVLCNGAATGAIDLSPSGGTGPLTYDWNTDGPDSLDNDMQDLNSLVAGTYIVEVTDSVGCFRSDTFFLTQAPVLVLGATVSNVLCNGTATGAIDLFAAGGSGALTYDWSNDGPDEPDDDPQDIGGLTAGAYTVTVTDANGCSNTASFSVTQPAVITLGMTPQNASCFGFADATVLLSAAGGTGAFTYDWSNDGPDEPDDDPQDMGGLAAGAYTVTVTDANGCSNTASATVTQPDVITLGMTPQNASCFGFADGTVLLSAAGGTGAFTYDWSNDGPDEPDDDLQNITGLAAGAYTVTVTDANGCSNTASATVTQPAVITLGITPQNASCYGFADGTVLLSAAGGTGAFTYDWSNDGPDEPDDDPQNIAGLTAGAYTVTVTDANGCSITGSTIVSQPNDLVLTSTVKNVACFGELTGSIMIDVAGGTPAYTFIWSNGTSGNNLLNVGAGNYAISVVDANGCVITHDYNISQPASPVTVGIDSITMTTPGNNSGNVWITVGGGIQPYSYIWTNLATQELIYTEDLLGVYAGVYSLMVMDSNQCLVLLDSIVIQVITDVITDLSDYTGFQLFPNPNPGIFNVVLKQENLSANYRFAVHTITGLEVTAITFGAQILNTGGIIDLKALPSGQYYLHLWEDGKILGYKTFIVQR